MAVLDRGATPRRDAEPPRGLEVDVRRRLAGGDLLRRDGGAEERRDPGQLEDEIDDRTVRGRGDGERPPRREALDRLGGAVDKR
jgi:hypothetical protein